VSKVRQNHESLKFQHRVTTNLFARCYRFSSGPAARRLTSRTGDSKGVDILVSIPDGSMYH
jgi:hypothetical protein